MALDHFRHKGAALIRFLNFLGWLLLVFCANYLGILVYTLFDAYFLDANNLTGISHYIIEVFCDVLLFRFDLGSSLWGIFCLIAFLGLFFWMLHTDRRKLELLAAIAGLSAFAQLVRSQHAPETRQLACLFLSLLVIGGLYAICRWVIWRCHRVAGAQSESSSSRANTFGAMGVTLLVAGFFLFVYEVIYWPLKQLGSVEFYNTATPAQAREVCHRALFWLGGTHDAFLTLCGVGDDSSVPYLISALRWQPETKSESEGMICTKGHCLSALYFITNQRPGVNYADWKKWWTVNKTKTRHQWVMEGFSQQGLSVTDPPDSASLDALVASTISKKGNLDCTIWYLKQQPLDLCQAAVERASRSTIEQERKAAIRCLQMMAWPDAESRLAPFLQDPSPELRKMAEKALKSQAARKKK